MQLKTSLSFWREFQLLTHIRISKDNEDFWCWNAYIVYYETYMGN